MATHKGELEAVLFGKILTPNQKKCMVWDVERGTPDKGQELAWQTCTCIGYWHYNRGRYTGNYYKSAARVICALIDIFSKNGNLLLNIPIRSDGTIHDKEVDILEGVAKWMDISKESIFDTLHWKIFGEGPSVDAANKLDGAGFNERKLAYTEKDIRYNQKGNVLYTTVMGVPTEDVSFKSLVKNIGTQKIKKNRTAWQQGKALVEVR